MKKKSESLGLFGSVLTKIHCVAHGFRGLGPQPEGWRRMAIQWIYAVWKV